MKKRIVALLPMKANSERVKGKNFRALAGKPLFRWMLDALLDMPEIDKVVINTDARHILAEHGLLSGGRIQVRDREPELCGDAVSMNRIIEDDIRAEPADLYLMTHTTNPLLSSATIRAAIAKLDAAAGRDSLFSVNRFQSRFYLDDLTPLNHDPANLVPTQNLPAWYEENSLLYLFTRDSFAATGARIGRHPVMFVTPKVESVDIDTPDDWDMAAALAAARDPQE